MKIYFWKTIIFLLIGQYLIAQGDIAKPYSSDPNLCYAKCLITSSEEIEEHEEAYPIYTGDRPDTIEICLLYTSPSPRDATLSRMPSSA